MPGHFRGLPVRMFQDGADRFVVTESFAFIRPCGNEVAVPVLTRGKYRLGFVTDGGSKPRIVMAIIGTATDRYFPAYVVHDTGYRCKPYGASKRGRVIVDTILLEAMEAIDAAEPAGSVTRAARAAKRATIYRMVRIFGRFWFHGKPLNLDKITPDHTGPDFQLIPDLDRPHTLRVHTLRAPPVPTP